MSEVIEKGSIVGWESAPEIYADEIVGIAIHQQAVAVTLAVNRVEPGKGSDARSIRAVVGRLVLPYATATELQRQLEAAARTAALDLAAATSQERH